MTISKRTGHPVAEAVGRLAAKVVFSVLVLYFVVLIVFKGAWDLLVPTLFPGAVEQGLVAKTISWWTAFLLSGALSLVLLWARWTSGSWFGSASKRMLLLEVKVNAIALHLGIDLDAAIKAEVAVLFEAGRKAQAIDLYRSYTGADLARAKEYMDGLTRSAASSATPSAERGTATDRPRD
jgi:hypothetical protein